MQGVPGHRSTLPAAHDHHLRMLDMAAFLNHGEASSLNLDQYNHSFAPAIYSSQLTGAPAPHMNHDHQSGLINGHQSGLINGLMKAETLEGGAGEQSAVTNVTSASGEVSGYSSSGEKETTTTTGDGGSAVQPSSMAINNNGLTVAVKAKRRLPGMPDPDAEVIALSPRTLLATNRFVCEICNKGFQRDQNLQLHRRGHNLPWKLKQRGTKEVRKKVYVCPETSCVHHDASRALGDLTGIKKHFSRKHGEKKWKCEKCSKRYAVQSDWKAHSKTCGTREYRCDCGTLFSRRDSFITHRAFCDALAEESALRVNQSGGLSFNAGLPNNTTLPTAVLHGGPFGNMIGGPTSSHAKNHGFLESSSFENSLVAATTPSSRTRLPSWLSHAAPGSIADHQQLMENPSQLNLPLNPALLDSYNGTGGSGSSHYYSNSGFILPGSATSLGQANGLIYGSNVSEFSLIGNSSNGNFPAMSSFHGLTALPSAPSLYNNLAASSPSSAQMSATSLLQKAAQMGSVVTSNPSLFKGYEVASSSDNTNPMYWHPTSSNQGSNGFSSIGVNHSSNRGSSSIGFHVDKANPILSGDTRRSNIMDSAAGIQEMLSSFNNGASAGFFMDGNTSNLYSRATSSDMGSSLPIFSAGSPRDHSHQDLFNHGSSVSDPSLMGLPISSKGEDGAAADNFTRDFLGVRGDNSILESMAKSLSQRSELGIDHHYSNSKENLTSDEENMSGQSHAKSWENQV